METGEVTYEKVHASPRFPTQISLKHDWMKEFARQAEGSQPTQPNPNPNHDRTGRPVMIGQPISGSTRWTSTSECQDCHILL